MHVLYVMDFKPLWLLDVDLFLNDATQEADFHIHLMDATSHLKIY